MVKSIHRDVTRARGARRSASRAGRRSNVEQDESDLSNAVAKDSKRSVSANPGARVASSSAITAGAN